MIFLPNIAKFLFKLFGILLYPYSLYLSIKQKCFKSYRYQQARGWDILAAKSYAPALNKHLVKIGGRQFGGDETISQTMAHNKYFGFNTSTADWWEKRINKFDKDHLKKTYENSFNLN